ncbi:DUF6499 domain-containing protein [Mesorhizobium sp. WSM4904]|uniref:transcriptional regulator domain-containing protein n=1 Tax=Mesorhizobium sp. WSM4904 TaxID=3038545 RepID=UPI0024185FE9|nr:DUF6499 domain-containing protein [Mesorhizobium sp. WSM4904]WFP65632.1 DUF6499 domain-containing protein [Mesorhizobium sp. WSM4904]
MSDSSSGLAWPDWQDKNAYHYSASLTSRGWAWEFLRRNRIFRAEIAAALRWIDSSKTLTGTIFRMPPGAFDLSSWGLIFCKLDRK